MQGLVILEGYSTLQSNETILNMQVGGVGYHPPGPKKSAVPKLATYILPAETPRGGLQQTSTGGGRYTGKYQGQDPVLLF
jgi:hypothetical protein